MRRVGNQVTLGIIVLVTAMQSARLLLVLWQAPGQRNPSWPEAGESKHRKREAEIQERIV